MRARERGPPSDVVSVRYVPKHLCYIYTGYMLCGYYAYLYRRDQGSVRRCIFGAGIVGFIRQVTNHFRTRSIVLENV